MGEHFQYYHLRKLYFFHLLVIICFQSLFPKKFKRGDIISFLPAVLIRCFPRSSVSKESACDAGDLGSIPGSERSPGNGNGNSLQCSCLENPMDGGAGGIQSMGSHET